MAPENESDGTSMADRKRRSSKPIVESFVERYNCVRQHVAIDYVTPVDKLAGREAAIFAERDRKLAQARERRAVRRREAALPAACENGTQRMASGVQGAAMSSLARVNANNSLAATAAP